MDSLKIEELQTLFFWAARRVCPGFVLREELLPAISLLFDWALGVETEGALDPRKGIYLYGNVGTGKTTMMEILRLWCSLVRPTAVGRYFGDRAGQPYTFATVSCRKVCDAYSETYYRGLRRFIIAPAICFDDFGTEPMVSLHFGTPERVMEYVVQGRYDRRRQLRATHFTSNKSEEDIRSQYDARVYDRLREMVNFVHYGTRQSKSFRKG